MSDDRSAGAGPLLIMHIPKTAGTTLRWVAGLQYPPGGLHPLYPGDGPQIDALAADARSGLPRAVIGHFRFGLHARMPAAAGYVAFVRDPVDRVVSHFNYLVGAGDPDNRGVLGPGDGLEEFVAHGWARNLQTQFVTGWTASEVEADPDRAFDRATDVLAEHFLGLGVVEQFAASLCLLADGLGWRVPSLPRLNPAPAGPRAVRRRDLGPSAVREIEDANACDRRLYEHVRAVVRARLRGSPGRAWRERVSATADWIARRLRPPR
jgi:hypothetical protein